MSDFLNYSPVGRIILLILSLLENRRLLLRGNYLSWFGFSIYGQPALPSALDQGNTFNCVAYSTYHLFSFQRRLLSLGDISVINYDLSLHHLIDILNKKPYQMLEFVNNITLSPLLDTVEYGRLLRGEVGEHDVVRRFRASFMIIDPRCKDSLQSTLSAIKYCGGVVICRPVFASDVHGNALYDGTTLNRQLLHVASVPHSADFANHAGFAYGALPVYSHSHGVSTVHLC